ncbi:phosphatase family protein [Aspergillus vadensis CBS 113365]|uniref:Phosphatase family protein n=1 Tax=Aspergillus vadensis (strain CBS 113365 / IMI 142717 / IBT 24658) TaxID=1448311 RepID=A0A319BS43_ASPVC|nr:phosphatase family protein [Aspergillus vadensis CBS 113365]PYH68653.1 phosphatase family protein [Aspergillus vadensis CBS 113365]
MASGSAQPASQPSSSSDSSSSNDPSPDPSVDPSSLPQAVKARKAEYTHQQTIRVKVGTWNVAAISGTENDIGKWFIQREGVCEQISGLRVSDSQQQASVRNNESGNGGSLAEFAPDKIGLYVLGLQEIVDVSSPAEALRPFVDPAPSNRWKAAVQKALPEGYKLIAETQLVGLLQLVYAAPFLADQVSFVSCTSVGTGLLGYMGNKGAVTTRLVLGETTCVVFVNCHLAAGSDKNSLERRNWDASQIVGRTKFEPIDPNVALREEPVESIGKEDFAFWFGDLNYRLEDIPGGDVRQVLARHTANDYDDRHQSQTGPKDSTPSLEATDEAQKQDTDSPLPAVSDEDVDPHTDPASLQTTISSLLPHDQLRMQQDKRKAFHDGWREGPITFLPTYKYDVGSVARFDTSEKNRGPSWCDRILYRTRQDRMRYERLAKEAAEARKRDEEMKARGLDKAVADDSVLFDYDPDVDGADSVEEYDPDKDSNGDASLDLDDDADNSLQLEYYVSHQGILSSDHKPLAAAFTLTYDSVDPQLKAKVHQEVVRELDKAENESRPGLTVVVDHHGSQPTSEDPNAVNFGDVPFDVPVTRTLTVANTSGVPATFTLEKPEQDVSNHTPSWLEYRIDQPHQSDSESSSNQKLPSHECTLHPGEIANIEVTACVRDIELTRLLNSGRLSLEEILVLRVARGRDHFISAHGKWLPTCFGRSLQELTVMPESGARSLVPAKAPQDQKDTPGVPLSAPRELFRLTEAISEISERAIAEWSMTRSEAEEDTPPWMRETSGFGWPFEPESWTLRDQDERSHLLSRAREALDTNKDFNSVFAPEVTSLQRLEILSETLLAFLGSLKDGIVTAAVWQDLDQQLLTREKTKQPPLSWEDSQAWVLESLAFSPVHSVSFTFVTFMLARIANEVAPASSIPNNTNTNTRGSTPNLLISSSGNEPQPKPTTQKNPPEDAPQPGPAPAAFIRRKTRTFTSSISSIATEQPSSLNSTPSPMAIRRQAVETALASIFSSVLISSDVTVPAKEKDRRALEERKRGIVEPFLKTIGVDNKGPSGGGVS